MTRTNIALAEELFQVLDADDYRGQHRALYGMESLCDKLRKQDKANPEGPLGLELEPVQLRLVP